MKVITAARVFLSRALDLVRRGERDERLSEEIETHLRLLTDEHIARGLSPADARAAARRSFGGVDQLKAIYRDERGLPIVEALVQDGRFAVRMLRRDRWFALTAVLVLAVGIGVNNMLFTILNAHTLRGLPIARAARVVYVSTFDERTPDAGLSYPDFAALQDGARSFTALAAFTSAPVLLSGDGRAAERLEAGFASSNAFAVVQARPVLGRNLSIDDDRPGAPAVVVLGASAWRLRYDADPSIVGRSILVNGAPSIVAGVVADRSGIPSTAAIWLPLLHAPGLDASRRDASNLRVFGRLRDGVTTDDARAEVETLFANLVRDHPRPNAKLRARLVPINARFLGSVRDPAWRAFMAAGTLIVLISCANVATLMLARSVQRARELAIRASLGASRRRIVRQLLIEGAVLAGIGGVAGLGVALAGVRLFRSAIPANALPYWYDYSLDTRVVLALVGVSTATVFVFALLPALRASKPDVNRVLKDGGRPGFFGRGSTRWTTAFLAAEFALAVVLLAQVVVSFRSNPPPVPSDAAVDTAEVVTAAITLPPGKYPTAEDRAAFHEQLAERVRAIPGVAATAVATALPLNGAPEARVDIAGQPPADREFQRPVRMVYVGAGYFKTFDLALVRGDDFTRESGTAGHAHAIVNERLAREYFGNRDPIGQAITITPVNAASGPHRGLTIVGIAPDVRQRATPEPDPVVYLPHAAAPIPTATVLVRSRTGGGDVVSSMRSVLMSLDAHLPLERTRTMAAVVRDAQWNARLSHWLILTLTAIAVGLATAGLYGATAYAVGQRTPEIGVRMALGAQSRHVALLIVRRALAQLAIGFGAGVICTLGWSRVFGGARGGLSIMDPQALAAIGGVLLLAALAACFVPARRAMALDPVAAIRGD